MVCGRLNAAHVHLFELVAAAETGCWSGAGIHSCEQWVAWKTGLSPARAHDLVLLARRCRELPEMVQALTNGELSVDQATVVARHAPTEYEADAVAFAKLTTVSQLRHTLNRYQFQDAHATPDVDPSTGPPDTAERMGVSGWLDQSGLSRLRAVLDADDGAIVDTALREARDLLFSAGDAA